MVTDKRQFLIEHILGALFHIAILLMAATGKYIVSAVLLGIYALFALYFWNQKRQGKWFKYAKESVSNSDMRIGMILILAVVFTCFIFLTVLFQSQFMEVLVVIALYSALIAFNVYQIRTYYNANFPKERNMQSGE